VFIVGIRRWVWGLGEFDAESVARGVEVVANLAHPAVKTGEEVTQPLDFSDGLFVCANVNLSEDLLGLVAGLLEDIRGVTLSHGGDVVAVALGVDMPAQRQVVVPAGLAQVGR
jgi:hypothetical protein